MPIRPARPDEGDSLTALSIRSKAHWGYDAAFMARAAPHLRLPADLLAQGRAFVSTIGNDVPAGVMALAWPDAQGVADLVLLFVDPPEIGKGHGKALLQHALTRARQDGATRLRVLSDPNAVAFYLSQGADHAGTAPSDAIPGRMLPLLDWALA